MKTSTKNKNIQEEFKFATNDELLNNIIISKILYILFSRNFYRMLVFGFSMVLNFYFYNKTGNEVRFFINSAIALIFSIFITNYLNSDKNAESEKHTIKILRKMREERKYE